MANKLKPVLAVLSEALESAAGYALVSVAIYAVLFVDLTGGGSLWKNLGYLHESSHDGLQSPSMTRVITVPTRPFAAQVHEDRILAVFDEAPPANVSALYQAPEAAGLRPAAEMSDTPADPQSGKIWKRAIRNELRRFTVYGNGEATTSAVMSGGGSPARRESARAVIPAEGSPARASTSAASRPGMSSRLSHGAVSSLGSSRNVL